MHHHPSVGWELWISKGNDQPLSNHKNHMRNLQNTSFCTFIQDTLTPFWIATWKSEGFHKGTKLCLPQVKFGKETTMSCDMKSKDLIKCTSDKSLLSILIILNMSPFQVFSYVSHMFFSTFLFASLPSPMNFLLYST